MWTLVFLVIIKWFFISSIHSQSSKTTVGPFQVRIFHAKECEDMGTGSIRWSMKVKKFNRTAYAFDAEAFVSIPVTDELSVSLDTAVLTNGGFKENFWSKEFPKFCTSILTLVPDLWRRIAKQAHIPGKGCPVAVGNYSLRNMPANFDVPGIPVFFYNRYRTILTVRKGQVKVTCVDMTIDVLPIKKNKGK